MRTQNRLKLIVAIVIGLATLTPPSYLRADFIVAGSLTFNLDGNAFASGADVGFLLSSGGVTYNTAQTFMEFAKHGSSALPGRPADATVTDFRDLRAGWSRPASTGLGYGFSSNAALQTMNFNPANVATAGATGNVRFTGGDSFWYGNDPIINTGSVWLMYGDMDLAYDASRIGGGNSGWFFRNNVLAPLPIFDVRNANINTAAGVLNISGDLFTSAEFRDNPAMPFFIKSGLDVGDFTFNGITAVPEPSSLMLMSVAVIGIGFVFRRRLRLKPNERPLAKSIRS